jgi:hypothetical protein
MISRHATSFLLLPLRTQSGQSMVETVIVFPVAMALIFGAIQFGLIFHAKITLNYAAYEAARYGSLDHATFEAVQEGFIRGFAPLFSYYNPGNDGVSSDADSPVHAYQDARYKLDDQFTQQEHLICIERLSPSIAAFQDFAPDGYIPNDNLIYRNAETGKISSTSIQDANLLHLRITYWYPLYVPLVNRGIAKIICTLDSYKDAEACRNYQDDPRIPITSVAVMRMQSAAKNTTEGWCTSKFR